MTTIDELRDITFYIIRKLNDFIINVTAQPQPRQQYREMTEEERRRDEEIDENIRRRIQEIRRRLDTPIPPPSPTIREEIVDEEHENIMRRIQEIRRRLDTPPPSTPKLIKDIYENLKKINNDHQPRCGSMEEFLENEIQKEKSFASFFDDKKREYEIRKEKIIEILELWKYDNISVDEIRERLNNL